MKQKIKNKFGTIRAFCQASGMNWFTVINTAAGRITNPKIIAEIESAIENTAPIERFPAITDDDRATLKHSLESNFCGSLTGFCKKYPSWNINFVHAVIHGRRKKKDQKFERLKFELINDKPFCLPESGCNSTGKKRGRPKKNIAAVLAMAAIMIFTSCEKEDPNDSSGSNSGGQCNCGTIANDGIDGNCYWLEIRNECSGNKKTFCFDEDIWMNNHPGDRFCVTNVSSW